MGEKDKNLSGPPPASLGAGKARPRRAWWWLLLPAALFVLSEGLLRWRYGYGSPPLYVTDPQVGYLLAARQSLRPFGHQVTINSCHQRSPETPGEPGPGVIRVLCLGDSVTFGGTGMDDGETWPARLERLLGLAGLRAEVLNASADSWGIGNLLAYLRKFGTCRAVLVILQIGTHDLYDPMSTAEGLGDRPLRRPWLAWQEFYRLWLRPRLLPPGSGPAPSHDPQAREASFQENQACLAAAVALCRHEEAKVLILHTPDRVEVVEGRTEPAKQEMRRRFLATCAEAGIPLVDLGRIWRADPQVGRYFADGVHLTVAGNEAAAARLAAELIPRLAEWARR